MSVSLYGSGQTVLQVVNATYGTTTSTSSSSFVDTGLSASITPQSTTSKILVITNISGVTKGNSNAQVAGQIVRGSTSILVFEDVALSSNTVQASGCMGASYLDSPSTTSSTTYKIQFSVPNSGGSVNINYNGNFTCYSTLTLLEISGS